MTRSVILSVIMSILCVTAHGQQTFESKVGAIEVKPVAAGPRQVPFILWGADVATFHANGGLATKPDSIFGQAGLNLNLVPGDDPYAQAKDYLSGKSPYFRGTVGMCSLAAELFNKNQSTKPVMFLQLSWSLGDHMVARDTVKTLNDLKPVNGKKKKVCLQQGGPHITLVDDSLKAVNLTWSDIEPVWADDLSASDKSPPEMMRKDPTIDVACVITPDMIGLCSDLKAVGTGAEGTVLGAHVVNSTSSMARSIPDVYLVRKDFYLSNRDEVEKFAIGYLKGAEELLAMKKEYADGKGKSPKYLATLKMAQSIYGVKSLPTIEVDAHGLVVDANIVRIPGNEIFFNDPNNLVGFAAKQKSSLDVAIALGYIKQPLGFEPVSWDYKAISQKVGVEYVPPVYATGRLKAEVTDFAQDVEGDTIFTFTIYFEPEQVTFPIETYASDFKRYIELTATFSNAATLIEGHSDPTLALQQFFWAAKAKGLITGSTGNYQFNGQAIQLTDTKTVLDIIQAESLAGQQRRDSRGQVVDIPDPRQTVGAALQLSLRRAENVKNSIAEFAQKMGVKVDLSVAVPRGVGIAQPVRPKPTNMTEAKENMRVVFRVVRVNAEALKEDDFNFDQ